MSKFEPTILTYAVWAFFIVWALVVVGIVYAVVTLWPGV